jgi:hypothetical protein
MRLVRTGRKVDRDDIEADGDLLELMFAEIRHGRARKPHLLFLVDRLDWGAMAEPTPGFDFHEDQGALINGNQIEL